MKTTKFCPVQVLGVFLILLLPIPHKVLAQDGESPEATLPTTTTPPNAEDATTATTPQSMDAPADQTTTQSPSQSDSTEGEVSANEAKTEQPQETEKPEEDKKPEETTPPPEPETTTEELTTSTTTTTTTTTTTLAPWKQKPKVTACQRVQHRVNSYWTCCGGKVMRNGMDFDKDWMSCYQPPPEEIKHSETISGSLTRLYNCFLEKTTAETSFSQQDLPEIMSRYYDDEYQGKIKDMFFLVKANAKTMGPVQLKVLYHYVERKQCDAEDPEAQAQRDIDDLQHCSSGTDVYNQNVHSGADCCDEKVIPMTLEFLRRSAIKELTDCTKNVMNTLAGPYGEYKKDLKFQDSDAQQMCFQACVLKKLGFGVTDESLQLEESFGYGVVANWLDDVRVPIFDYKPIFERLTQLFSPTIASAISETFVMEYGPPLNFTQGILDDEGFYNRTYKIYETEFFNMEWRYTKPLFVKCEAYNIIVREIERGLTDRCYNMTTTT